MSTKTQPDDLLKIEKNGGLLTLEESASILRLKVSTLRAWRLQRKNLSFLRVGGRIRVRAADVAEFLESSIVPALAPEEALTGSGAED